MVYGARDIQVNFPRIHTLQMMDISSIHERFPSVMHPSFHLDNGQRTYFTTGNASKKVQNPHKTTL